MDWLAKYLAVIDCARKQVMLRPWGEGEVMHVGSRVRPFRPGSLFLELIVREEGRVDEDVHRLSQTEQGDDQE
jgi:hypothetical protein